MKAKDFTILLVLVALLLALQLGMGVIDGLRWDIPSLSANDYTIDNRCYAEIIFETVEGDEWLRVSHELERKLDPAADFQIRRDDGERMVVQIDDVMLRGRTVGIKLDQYEPPVQITTCADRG